MTRDGDQTISLTSRLKRIDELSPDLFISLHLGANPFDTSLSGFRLLTSNEDSFEEETKLFSNLLTNELGSIDELLINPSKEVNFVVLKSKAVPSLLIEIGYMTNFENREFVNMAGNQKEISEKILSAIVSYRNRASK